MRNEGSSESREIILRAALEALAEHKISGTRMKHIASRSGMSQGNVHYHFPTKENLYTALLDMMQETFTSESVAELQDPGLPAETKLNCIFEQKKRFLRFRREFMDVYYDFWVQATKSLEIQQKMQEQYRNWRRDIQGLIREAGKAGELDTQREGLISILIVAVMEGAAMQYLIDPDAINLDEYFNLALGMVLGLFGIERGPEAEADGSECS